MLVATRRGPPISPSGEFRPGRLRRQARKKPGSSAPPGGRRGFLQRLVPRVEQPIPLTEFHTPGDLNNRHVLTVLRPEVRDQVSTGSVPSEALQGSDPAPLSLLVVALVLQRLHPVSPSVLTWQFPHDVRVSCSNFLIFYLYFISLSWGRGLKVCIQSCSAGSLVIRFFCLFWPRGSWDLSSLKVKVLVAQFCPTLCHNGL